MKNLRTYITLISLALLISCSGDDDGAPPITVNQAPAAPSLVFPSNNLTCTNFNLEFEWNAVTDPDGDEVSYVIEIAANSNFTTVLFTAVTSETTRTFTLEKGVTYYWRVKAGDTEGNESEYSGTQSFFTEPEAGINTIPSVPQLISPAIGNQLSDTTVTLDWEATDTDDDALVYDVYFGDTNPPVLFSENIDMSELEVTLSPNTIYYWRVVVKDNHQSATIGQVWNFRTE